MDTWKGIGVYTSHGGVMGSHMRCTKMHQNEPKWSPYHDRAKVFWICLEWLIWSSSGLNGHLKGDRSLHKSWRGHGVTHEMHQNAPKCTKTHQNAPKWSPYQDRAKVFRIFPEWLIWSFSGLNGHLKGDSSQSKSWRDLGVTHEVHQNAPKWTKMVTVSWQSKSVLNLSWVT